MNAAKWIKIPVLFSLNELTELIETVGPSEFFPLGRVVPIGTRITAAQFLQEYSNYLLDLCSDSLPQTRFFSLLWTKNAQTVEKQVLVGEREIIRPAYPSVQIQAHHFQFDTSTMECRSMLYGTGSIPWGLQFSYPHLFEDPQSLQIQTVDQRFINTSLFHTIRQFIRNRTQPTPLRVNERKVNIPLRIGKECFAWIQNYPWMRQQGIQIYGI